MKEIRETKIVEQTTVSFISEDGKEFETEHECKQHELKANNKKLEIDFNRILLANIKPLEMFGVNCDTETYIIKVENVDDLDCVIAYFSSRVWSEFDECGATFYKKMCRDIENGDCLICIVEEINYAYTIDLKQGYKQVLDAIDKLGNIEELTEFMNKEN